MFSEWAIELEIEWGPLGVARGNDGFPQIQTIQRSLGSGCSNAITLQKTSALLGLRNLLSEIGKKVEGGNMMLGNGELHSKIDSTYKLIRVSVTQDLKDGLLQKSNLLRLDKKFQTQSDVPKYGILSFLCWFLFLAQAHKKQRQGLHSQSFHSNWGFLSHVEMPSKLIFFQSVHPSGWSFPSTPTCGFGWQSDKVVPKAQLFWSNCKKFCRFHN